MTTVRKNALLGAIFVIGTLLPTVEAAGRADSPEATAAADLPLPTDSQLGYQTREIMALVHCKYTPHASPLLFLCLPFPFQPLGYPGE